MRTSVLAYVVIVCISLLSGCASITMLTNSYPQKSQNESIDVYITNRPSCQYEEIAIIKCESLTDNRSINQAKSKARKIGADAIIIVGSASVDSAAVPIGNNSFAIASSSESGVKAIAIKYKK